MTKDTKPEATPERSNMQNLHNDPVDVVVKDIDKHGVKYYKE